MVLDTTGDGFLFESYNIRNQTSSSWIPITRSLTTTCTFCNTIGWTIKVWRRKEVGTIFLIVKIEKSYVLCSKIISRFSYIYFEIIKLWYEFPFNIFVQASPLVLFCFLLILHYFIRQWRKRNVKPTPTIFKSCRDCPLHWHTRTGQHG